MVPFQSHAHFSVLTARGPVKVRRRDFLPLLLALAYGQVYDAQVRLQQDEPVLVLVQSRRYIRRAHPFNQLTRVRTGAMTRRHERFVLAQEQILEKRALVALGAHPVNQVLLAHALIAAAAGQQIPRLVAAAVTD